MKRPLLILLVLALGVSSRAGAQTGTPAIPAMPAASATSTSMDTSQNTAYNPDPGASEKPIQAPFYQPPPGTPPDYESEREPIIDQPHAPLLDIHRVQMTFQNRDYPEEMLPPGTMGVPDRWDMDIPIWMRYNAPERETPYMTNTPRLWDPYKQSVLKGDVPVAGQDIFLSLTATSFTSYEARDIPTPSGVSTQRPDSSEFFGEGNQQEVDQFLTFKLDLFKGETVFQPVTWDLHLEPVYNINYIRVKENGVVSVDPRGSGAQSDNAGVVTNNSGNGSTTGGTPGGFSGIAGSLTPGNPGGLLGPGESFGYVGGNTKLGDRETTRTKDFASLQQAFLEFHLQDFTDNYDFVSMRIGNQPFNSDFRGFVFNDTNLGFRLFGNMDDNRWQYNVAAFDMREKDTYSELNTFDSRHQFVFIANAYRQDFFAKGYTAQLSFLTNLDQAYTHFDRTGNQVEPADIGGPVVPHHVHAYYFGINGDGHIGRLNITNSFYEVIGRDSDNGIAGQPVDINAQMGALELSYDQDWIRFTSSFFYASGDNNPTNKTATGFDTILDNPNFIGGPFSYYSSEGFIFGDTNVNFKQPNSLVVDLRSSKTEGQANFVNPGVFIYGVGTNMDLLPTLRLFLNANYIMMANTETVNFALHTQNVTPSIGWDLSGGIQYRPLLTDNIIVSAGLGALIPANGYRAIYQTNTIPVPGYSSPAPDHVDNFLYSAFASVTFTY